MDDGCIKYMHSEDEGQDVSGMPKTCQNGSHAYVFPRSYIYAHLLQECYLYKLPLKSHPPFQDYPLFRRKAK